jgi:predicted Zn-dependent peptidase
VRRPDVSEPRQEQERRASVKDALATRPALALGYHAPARLTPEYYALGLIDQVLLQGRDSRLWRALVEEGGFAAEVTGGINADLGHMFNIGGPTLWSFSLVHDPGKPAADIVAAAEREIEVLRQAPLDAATLERARVKMRSALYGQIEDTFDFGRADMLASFALFDDDPGLINRLEDAFARVTPELIQKTAREYLRPNNRTVLTLEPGAVPAAAAGGTR